MRRGRGFFLKFEIFEMFIMLGLKTGSVLQSPEGPSSSRAALTHPGPPGVPRESSVPRERGVPSFGLA